MKHFTTILLYVIFSIIAIIWVLDLFDLFTFIEPSTPVYKGWWAAIAGAMSNGGGGGGGGGGMGQMIDKADSKIQGRHQKHMQGTQGAMQAVKGVVDLGIGMGMKKKAQGLFPERIDPIRSNALMEYKRMERGSGTGSLFQGQVNKLMQGERGVQVNIGRKSGGNTGQALSALAMSSRYTGQQKNDLLGKIMEHRDKYTALADATSKEISQRKLELDSWKYSQKMAEATQMISSGRANMDAGAANMISSA